MFLLALWKVRRGLVGRYRAVGSSMEPVIPSGSRVTIEPVDVDRIELGDIVVVRVGEATMLHLVKTIDLERREVEIAGTGSTSGWTSLDCVHAICTRIQGKKVPGAGEKTRRRFPGLVH